MGGPERGIQIPVKETGAVYTPAGDRVGPVGLLDKPKEVNRHVSISPEAAHETGHTLVGWVRSVGIDGVDIIPSGNARGRTYPDQFDAPTAAAGYATGTGGEGYDQFVTEEIYHQNFSKAATTASVIIQNNKEAFMDLGTALDTHKSLSRRDINSILTNSMERKRKKESKKTLTYEIPTKSKDGKEEIIRVEAPKGATMLHVPLPQSGDIFVAAEREISLSP